MAQLTTVKSTAAVGWFTQSPLTPDFATVATANSNRKPLNLPKNYSTVDSNLNLGDVILFSTTLLHKTSAGKHPRLGLAMTIKNFKYKEASFSDNHNWKIFSYSEMTKIQRILGNHYLSPFRVIDNENDIEIS